MLINLSCNHFFVEKKHSEMVASFCNKMFSRLALDILHELSLFSTAMQAKG